MSREAPSQEPIDDRPTKRLRTGQQLKSAADEQSNAGECGLPPELWALVMPFMPYSDNIRCSILNKTFLKEVASRVKHVTVFSPNEMKVGPVARRFSSVESVTIACLFRGDHVFHCGVHYSKRKGDVMMMVSDETVGLLVPFLANFPALETFQVGGYVEEPSDVLLCFFEDWGNYYSDDESGYVKNYDLMVSLMVSLGGAYRSGLLSPDARMKEKSILFQCSKSRNPDGKRCPLCCTFFECFPMDQVTELLPCNGQHCCDIGEAFDVIFNRPGGKKALTTKEFILSMISRHGKNYRRV